jgi:hypothetical protein
MAASSLASPAAEEPEMKEHRAARQGENAGAYMAQPIEAIDADSERLHGHQEHEETWDGVGDAEGEQVLDHGPDDRQQRHPADHQEREHHGAT